MFVISGFFRCFLAFFSCFLLFKGFSLVTWLNNVRLFLLDFLAFLSIFLKFLNIPLIYWTKVDFISELRRLYKRFKISIATSSPSSLIIFLNLLSTLLFQALETNIFLLHLIILLWSTSEKSFNLSFTSSDRLISLVLFLSTFPVTISASIISFLSFISISFILSLIFSLVISDFSFLAFLAAFTASHLPLYSTCFSSPFK